MAKKRTAKPVEQESTPDLARWPSGEPMLMLERARQEISDRDSAVLSFWDLRTIGVQEAEEVSAVVCLSFGMRSHFNDNVFAYCNDCRTPIFYRPYAPKKPPKICIPCADIRRKGSRA